MNRYDTIMMFLAEGHPYKELARTFETDVRTIRTYDKVRKGEISRGSDGGVSLQNRRLTREEKRQLVIEKYRNNEPVMQISHTIHVSHQTIKNWVAEAGLPLRKQHTGGRIEYEEAMT